MSEGVCVLQPALGAATCDLVALQLNALDIA